VKKLDHWVEEAKKAWAARHQPATGRELIHHSLSSGTF
jgi:hypothetical protein